MNRLRICFGLFFRSRHFTPIPLGLLLSFAFPSLPAQTLWNSIGPAGGDARALASVQGDPNHLYLGSTNSWLYESMDQGASWHRLAKMDKADDLILDHIIVDATDAKTLFVAAWTLDNPGGGVWTSHDGGHTWSESEALHGQSIRAFAQAPSNPAMLFAGTLDGVYRSKDAGVSWTLISPPESKEIHEVESLAIDPTDPNIVYAGTWHLPWKTTDGGTNWHNIKDGVIDDSDVFSIIVDPVRPEIVFASACSGIYKSENSGELFKKIAGIPADARRTRVLKQDPQNPLTVYAGTTEGLYKSVDGGKKFKALTDSDVIVNDIFVDGSNADHVLLATDRSGVLVSNDAGASFASSNDGFSGRKVEALLVDRDNPARVYAGVVNDKRYGGVFTSVDGGEHWDQLSRGLDERDVFALAESADGTVLAGTSHGIFVLDVGTEKKPTKTWKPSNVLANMLTRAATETHYGMRVNVEKKVKDKVRVMEGRVTAIDLSTDVWLVSTMGGLYTSVDKAATWQGGPVMGTGVYLSVAARGRTLAAARPDGVVVSQDAGLTWMPMSIPSMLTRIHRVAFSADGTLWLGAREGVYFTRDMGKTWLWIERLPFRDVDDLYYDAERKQMLATSRSSDQIYMIDPKTLAWQWAQTGYRIALIRTAGERLIAASVFDGVLVEAEATAPDASVKQ